MKLLYGMAACCVIIIVVLTIAVVTHEKCVEVGTVDIVVQPGDTLWSIVSRVNPGEDARLVIDAMDISPVIYPGQIITVPFIVRRG